MQTTSTEIQTAVLTLLAGHPQATGLIIFAALVGALKKSKLSLKLGFSSKVLGSWSVQIEHGKDALPEPKNPS